MGDPADDTGIATALLTGNHSALSPEAQSVMNELDEHMSTEHIEGTADGLGVNATGDTDVAVGGAVADADVDDGVIEQNQLAKSCVSLNVVINQKTKKPTTSRTWSHFKLIKVQPGMLETLIQADPIVGNRFQEHINWKEKGLKFDARVFICEICFNDDKISLADSVKATPKGNHVGNFAKHLEGTHGIKYKKGKRVPVSVSDVTKSKKRNAEIASLSSCTLTAPPMNRIAVPLTPPPKLGAAFQKYEKAGYLKIQTEWHRKIMLFANDGNVSQRMVTCHKQ